MLVLALALFFGGLIVAFANVGIAIHNEDITGFNIVVHAVAALSYIAGMVVFAIWAIEKLAG